MKQWILVVFTVVAFTQQPSKAAESQRVTEGKSAQVGNQPNRGENSDQPAKQGSLANNQHQAAEVNTTATKSNNDTEIQGEIVTFTGLLVVIGFLQFFALVGQVVIYCRQAKIMSRQAHEMKRQRGYMRLQWKAMGTQISHVEQQHHVEQRAWVGAWAEIVERDGAIIKFRIVLKNTGPTPALNVIVEPGMAFKGRDYLIPDDLSPEHKSRLEMDKGAEKESQYTVLPNDTSTSPVYILDASHPPRPMPAPDKGDWVFLRGTIAYADIFGHLHTTTFMQRVEGRFLHWANLGNAMT